MPSPIKASTQEHLDIYTVQNDTVILKDGSASFVLQTTAINFSLLSEEEQDAIMHAYAGLINSLSFPVQILIRSQKKDISEYLDILDERIKEVQSQKVREAVIRYRRFVKSMVKEKRVLEKRFYVVIPFSTAELGLTKSSFNPLAKKPQKPPFDLDYILEKASMTLIPRRDHLISQFSRIGLKTQQLNSSQLINLFHLIYNSGSIDETIEVTPEDTASNLTTAAPKGTNTMPDSIQTIFSRK